MSSLCHTNNRLRGPPISALLRCFTKGRLRPCEGALAHLLSEAEMGGVRGVLYLLATQIARFKTGALRKGPIVRLQEDKKCYM